MSDLKSLFQPFHEVATQPKKQLQAYVAAGKPVFGIAPGYAPEELFHAMGCVPFGLWGKNMQVEEAKRYFPAFIPSILQSILELGINGEYEGMTAFTVPALSDSTKALGENWKYAVPSIPYIPCQLPQNRRIPAGRDFTRACYQRMVDDLAKLTGATLEEDKLQASIEIYNEHNRLLREFSLLVADHDQVTPAMRNDVFKSAWYMLKEEHNALLRDLLPRLKEEPVLRKNKRIITSGIVVDDEHLLRVLEDCGMTVVADDVLQESRQYRVDATEGETGMDRLVNQFADMDNCSLLYDRDKKRADLLVRQAKELEADGVILFLTKFSDSEEFDYVPIKRALDAAGIPILLLEIDRQMERFDQQQTAIETFADIL